ncbi:MAG: lipocalin-like domain-containing protein [Anaerolineae bacterium]|nr:lipocalin-like domain-containing protein [Anaerolineae bacterium]
MSISAFIGTWRLIRQELRAPDGMITYPRGEYAIGQLIYTADHHMAVQLIRVQDLRAEFCDLLTEQTALEGTLSYYGRYQVDETRQIVIHQLDGCSFLAWRGQTLTRAYQFSDHDGHEYLILSAQHPVDGDPRLRVLIWQRIGR